MKLICLNYKLHFCVLCQIDCNKTKNCHVVTLCSLLHGTQYWVQIRVRVKKGPWSEWSSSQTGVTLESGSLQINSEWHNQLFQHLLLFRLFLSNDLSCKHANVLLWTSFCVEYWHTLKLTIYEPFLYLMAPLFKWKINVAFDVLSSFALLFSPHWTLWYIGKRILVSQTHSTKHKFVLEGMHTMSQHTRKWCNFSVRWNLQDLLSNNFSLLFLHPLAIKTI